MAFPLVLPRYWPTWIGILSMWGIALLPLRAQFALGRLIGALGYRLARERRHIAQINVALCFPEQGAEERSALVRRNFASTGISAVETALAWFREPARYSSRVTVEGLELLLLAQRQGRGVLLVGAHFATLDLAGALLSLFVDLDVIYRYNKNPAIEWLMRRGRQRLFKGVIERRDTRTILTSLKAGHVVWYAADQDYGPKVSVFAPFFGVPAATITATARFARANSSPVIFISHFRDPDTRRWSIHFSAVPADYPTGDDYADATMMNSIIEREIRTHPDQYLWMHRRFKTQPPGHLRPY